MTWHKTIISLLLAVSLCPISSLAAKKLPAEKNSSTISYVGAYAGTGFSSLLHQIPNTNVLGGGFGSIGAKYQLQTKKRFIFSVGVETMMLHSVSTLDDFALQGIYNYNDPLGNSTQMEYKWQFSNYREMQNQWSIDMPILCGTEFRNAYFGLGLNLRYNCLGGYKATAIRTTSAIDQQLIGALENIPTHQLCSQPIQKNDKLAFGIDIMAMAEVGVKLYKKKDITYQLGLFAAYEVWGTDPHTHDNAIVQFDNTTYQIANSLFTTPAAQDKAINTLMVGIKFIVLFQMNHICRTCSY